MLCTVHATEIKKSIGVISCWFLKSPSMTLFLLETADEVIYNVEVSFSMTLWKTRPMLCESAVQAEP